MRCFGPIKFLIARRCALFPLEGCLQADFNKGLPCAFHGHAPHVEGLPTVLIGPRRAWRTLIGLQQKARPRKFVSSGFACGNQGEEVLSFCIGSRHFVAFGWPTHLLGTWKHPAGNVSAQHSAASHMHQIKSDKALDQRNTGRPLCTWTAAWWRVYTHCPPARLGARPAGSSPVLGYSTPVEPSCSSDNAACFLLVRERPSLVLVGR